MQRTGTVIARFLAVIFVIGAVAMVIVLVVQVRASQPPEWWAQVEVPLENPVERAAKAERGLTNLVDQARMSPEPEPAVARISEADANAWLAERLPRWLANQDVKLPHGLVQVRTTFVPGGVLLGVQFVEDGESRIFTASFAVATPAEGRPVVSLQRCAIGRQPVPISMIRARLSESGRGALDTLLSRNEGGLRITLPDGSEAHLWRLDAGDGELTIGVGDRPLSDEQISP